MAKLKAKVWVTREGKRHCPVVAFEEVGNGTPYGSGQYIAVVYARIMRFAQNAAARTTPQTTDIWYTTTSRLR